MLEALRNAWRLPDVRNKLLITGLILVIYQFAAHVPVVGVNRTALQELLSPNTAGAGLINVLNLLSGGAVANFSVIANGVYPYITASIIFQLLIPIVPRLQEVQKEPGGQEKIQRWTYYATIPMAFLQAFGQIQIFNTLLLQSGSSAGEIIPRFGSDPLVTISVLMTMTAGTMFAVWLGELITEQGIGNGISIIIFAGIVANAPRNFLNLMGDIATPGVGFCVVCGDCHPQFGGVHLCARGGATYPRSIWEAGARAQAIWWHGDTCAIACESCRHDSAHLLASGHHLPDGDCRLLSGWTRQRIHHTLLWESTRVDVLGFVLPIDGRFHLFLFRGDDSKSELGR